MGDMPLRTEHGNAAFMRDVATPKDDAFIQTNIVRGDSRKQVSIPIFRQLGASTLSVIDTLKSSCDDMKARLSKPGVDLKLVMDQSVHLDRPEVAQPVLRRRPILREGHHVDRDDARHPDHGGDQGGARAAPNPGDDHTDQGPDRGRRLFPFLYLTGTAVNVQSISGIIFIIGIKVASTVLMTGFAQEIRRHEGFSPLEAIRWAVSVRVRPVTMTALAAFFAMIPAAMALEKGSEANAPLARAILGGFLVGEPTTLFVLPCLYSLMVRDKPKSGNGNGPESGDHRSALANVH